MYFLVKWGHFDSLRTIQITRKLKKKWGEARFDGWDEILGGELSVDCQRAGSLEVRWLV